MSGEELTRRQIVDSCDGILTTIERLRDQVVALKRKAEGVNPVGEMLAFFDKTWMGRYDAVAHYQFNGAADASNVRRWLKTMDVATLKGRITRYFADDDAFLVRHKHPFNMFIKNFNTYVQTAAPGASTTPDVQHVPDCSGDHLHDPRCTSDAEHTRRRAEDLKAGRG